MIIPFVIIFLIGLALGWATYYIPLDIFYKIRWIFSKHVHTELYYDNETWEKIKKNCKTKKTTWYVITPANYDYLKVMFGCEYSKEGLGNILAKRVHWLVANGQKIGLHIHFNHTRDMPYGQMDKMFMGSLIWARDNNIHFTEGFVSGYWIENDDIKRLCCKYRLRCVPRTRFYMHDFELRKNK